MNKILSSIAWHCVCCLWHSSGLISVGHRDTYLSVISVIVNVRAYMSIIVWHGACLNHLSNFWVVIYPTSFIICDAWCPQPDTSSQIWKLFMTDSIVPITMHNAPMLEVGFIERSHWMAVHFSAWFWHGVLHLKQTVLIKELICNSIFRQTLIYWNFKVYQCACTGK